MITEQQYKEAIAAKEKAERVITAFHKQRIEDFEARWERFEKNNEFFTPDDLVYSAGARCDKCQAGLAYPKNCGIRHQWTCSAVLTGPVTEGGHSAYPFAFYEIKGENQPSAYGSTTRPKV